MTAAAVSSEPKGIAAAMSQPVFSTRMGQTALGAADRATRRWAPEAPEDQPRSMRSLSFVDRMVAPWVTAAQRSAGLRMFSQYASAEVPERAISGVSWVFPRPWYQDELDWIAASRANQAGHDMIFTTRGTYAAAADRHREASLPPQLFEYVAPSFAPASSDSAVSAYSPLVSHASYSAASVVAQSMQTIQAASALARGLPVAASASEAPGSGVSSGSLAGISSLAPLVSSLIPTGESSRFSVQPSALALRAPTLVTPPAPRGDGAGSSTGPAAEARSEHAAQVARGEQEAAAARATAEVMARQEQSRAMAQAFAQERERVAEQMRVAARAERAQAPAEAAPEAAAPSQAAIAEAAAREAIRAEVVRQEAARVRETSSRVRSAARQQARIDAIVAERVAHLEASAGDAPVASAPAVPAMPVAPSEAQSQALVQALRMAELLAHTAAVGPSAMAPSAGPRMALPTGLGGLVSGMNTVSVIHRERALAADPSVRREGAPLPFVSGFQPVFATPVEDQRAAEPIGAPALAGWSPRVLAPETLRTDSALGSIASRAPAALGHVAWADRWLGRFAGASEEALDAMSPVAMRARLAPSQLFVSPMLDVPRQEAQPASRFSAPALDVVAPSGRQETPSAVPAPRAEAPRSQPSVQRTEALRFADDDVVPDELFAAIAATPPRRQPSQVAAPTIAPAAAPAATLPRSAVPQLGAVDVLALTAPSAPVDAGLSAALAASPMAPALGHVLPLPRAAVFDPRSLSGAELAAAFLSGSITAPMVTQLSSGAFASRGIDFSVTGREPTAQQEAPSLWRQWSAELVRPAELTRAPVRDDGAVPPSTPRPSAVPAAEAASIENIITLRSTLLSPASPRQQRLAASSGTMSSWANHEPIDALPVAYQTLGELLTEAVPDRGWPSSSPGGLAAEGTLPAASGWERSAPLAARFDQGFPLVFWPLAASVPPVTSTVEASPEAPRAARAPATRAPWAAPEAELLTASPGLVEQGMPGSMDRGALSPGMLAQRALGFGAVQSSQTADLSFDFVPPELVLAARVYGFGAAEAAQAARLAMGGATGLSAMAGAVDLRFVSLVSPMRQEAGRPGAEGQRESGAFSAPRQPEESAAARESDTAFGVTRRMPRGAYLLPSASVAAMGLSAALPEGEHAMSIAALEVLAAKMVADLGSFASPSLGAPTATSAEPGMAPSRRAPGATLIDLGQTSSERADAMEASEAAVLSSASASITASRRARFESLYVALAESTTGRTMSPAARAARALALANRDEEAPSLSSRERAALAWQIYPVVLSGEGTAPAETREGEEARSAPASMRSRSVPELPKVAPLDRPGAEMRPGLAPLSARAGEALSSFVTTTQSETRSAPAAESRPGNWRSGRYGGGEVEIPEWFEAAARKMFEDRGEIEGISLAELTLVAATPPTQIAAATREAPSTVPQKQASDGKGGEKGEKVDIEKVAGEVYRAVMQLMESARMRNGEPYL